MKRTTAFTLILILSGFAAFTQDVSDLFYKAVHLQEVKGDLEAAIPLFEKVVSESKDPSLAAKAQLRIGMCYEKLGLTRAQQAYQKVIDRYPGQSQEVAIARERIAALNQAAAAKSAVQAAGAIVARQVWTDADRVFMGAPSPDGKYITFIDSESGNLAIRDLEAERQSLLTNEGSWEPPEQFAEYSRWSPDGKQIAYGWWRGSEIELRILSLDGRRARVLFRNDDVDWIDPQDWSPDARQILASIVRKGAHKQLGLISVADGSERSLKTDCGAARFSPDGRFIVYDRPSGADAAGDLFVMTVDGTEEDALVKHPADDTLVGWSPDGNWVLFSSDRTGTRSLWMLPMTKGKPAGEPRLVKASIGRICPLGLARDGSFYYADVKVTRDIYSARIDLLAGKVLTPPAKAIQRFEGSNMNPAYSPDGNYLAFISKRGQMVFPTYRGNALCIQPLGGGSERVFFEEFPSLGVRYIAGPRWAPDSRSILIAGWGSKKGICNVNIETGKVELVLELPAGAELGHHEWARDGRGFFYVRQDPDKNSCRLLYRALKTGDERELHLGSAGEDYLIATSPDGRWLSFMNRGPNEVLKTMPSSGGTPREIYRFGQRTCYGPEWTPDGKSIIVTCRQPGKSSWILCRIAAEGGAIHELGLEAMFSDKVSMHPDGQRIAFTVQNAPDSASDVWVMNNFLPKEDSGFKIRQVYTGMEADGLGKVSPDGRYLSSVDWNTGDLAVLDLVSGTKRQLTDKGSWDKSNECAEFSVWSPDGKQIVYVWMDGSKFVGLGIADTEGSKPRILYRSEKGEYVLPADWSHDGKHILAAFYGASDEDSADRRCRLGLVSAKDGSVRLMKNRGWQSGSLGHMGFSPDSQYIAYDSDSASGSSNRDIFVTSVDGKREIPLVVHPANDYFLGWSPDGNWILFLSDRTGTLDTWVLRMDGGKAEGVPALVRAGIGMVYPWGFSREGTFYYSTSQFLRDIYVAPFDPNTGKVAGSANKLILSGEGRNSNPDYSPDGKYLAYIRASLISDRTTTLRIRSLDTQEESEVSLPFRARRPRWSPDSRYLLVSAEAGIFRINAQTGARDRLGPGGYESAWSNDGGSYFYVTFDWKIKLCRILKRNIMTQSDYEIARVSSGNPIGIAISPDGSWVAFPSPESKMVLKIVPAEGGEARILYAWQNEGGLPNDPAWSLDGKHLIFQYQRKLWRISVEGGMPEELGLEMNGVECPVLHPNGRHIVFSGLGASDRVPEIWVMENFLPRKGVRP